MNINRVKSTVFDILDKSEQNGPVERIFDIIMILLIIANVLAVIVEPSITDPAAVHFMR